MTGGGCWSIILCSPADKVDVKKAALDLAGQWAGEALLGGTGGRGGRGDPPLLLLPHPNGQEGAATARAGLLHPWGRGLHGTWNSLNGNHGQTAKQEREKVNGRAPPRRRRRRRLEVSLVIGTYTLYQPASSPSCAAAGVVLG